MCARCWLIYQAPKNYGCWRCKVTSGSVTKSIFQSEIRSSPLQAVEKGFWGYPVQETVPVSTENFPKSALYVTFRNQFPGFRLLIEVLQHSISTLLEGVDDGEACPS